MGSALVKGKSSNYDVDTVKDWLQCATFEDILKKEKGLDEFRKFIEKKSENDLNRLDFFCLCHKIELAKLKTDIIDKYLVEGPNVISDVRRDDNVSSCAKKAGELHSYFEELKSRIRPDLNEHFRSFKEDLYLKHQASKSK